MYWRHQSQSRKRKLSFKNTGDKFCEEAIENKQEEARLKREELRGQLRKKLLADPDFHKCTNKELRMSYAQKLCNADKSIQDLFYSPNHKIYDITIGTFIEEVWKEYKAN